MANPITALLGTVATISNTLTLGVEGTSSYLQLWRNKQQIEHKYTYRVFKLEALASYGQRTEKAQQALANLAPEVVAYLQSND